MANWSRGASTPGLFRHSGSVGTLYPNSETSAANMECSEFPYSKGGCISRHRAWEVLAVKVSSRQEMEVGSLSHYPRIQDGQRGREHIKNSSKTMREELSFNKWC